MKYIIPAFLFVSFLFVESGCKKVIENVIGNVVDCATESSFLSINAGIDTNNTKLVHFEFINNNAENDDTFTLDKKHNWDFGDGSTAISTDAKVDHTYAKAGVYNVKATYTLRKGGSPICNGSKEKASPRYFRHYSHFRHSSPKNQTPAIEPPLFVSLTAKAHFHGIQTTVVKTSTGLFTGATPLQNNPIITYQRFFLSHHPQKSGCTQKERYPLGNTVAGTIARNKRRRA